MIALWSALQGARCCHVGHCSMFTFALRVMPAAEAETFKTVSAGD